jgi:hypothetical protein
MLLGALLCIALAYSEAFFLTVIFEVTQGLDVGRN